MLTREILMTELPCQPTNVSVSAPVVSVVAIWGWSASASICYPRASQHIRNSWSGLLHEEDRLLLKALQLLSKSYQRSSDLLESLLSIPWCPRCSSLVGAGCPPHHTRHTCLRLRISRTAVLYLARASPESLNPYNGVELH